MKMISKSLYNWASIIEESTVNQAQAISSMPFIYPHVAIMPDAHAGKGACVGAVIPTLGAIMPAAVGVDIGCGMIAVKTQWKRQEVEGDLSKLRHSIERGIPLSAGGYNKELTDSARQRTDYLESIAIKDYALFAPNWKLQLGTLGSGNHFIEITIDQDEYIWLFLHSGSRGIGNKIASYHIKQAQDICKRYFIQLPDPDCAYLVENTDLFDDYMADLAWAQEFALLNREEMMDRVIKDMSQFMGESVQEQERINCHHNYTVKRNVFGKNVWLSRKGAIDASVGTKGLIPGSMGTASYVVEGKGNEMSFHSAPHGAGRVYSRNDARKLFTLAHLEKAMEGIEYRKTDAFIDEIPSAYKDIDQIMIDAADLVEIKHTLRQIVNIKGD